MVCQYFNEPGKTATNDRARQECSARARLYARRPARVLLLGSGEVLLVVKIMTLQCKSTRVAHQSHFLPNSCLRGHTLKCPALQYQAVSQPLLTTSSTVKCLVFGISLCRQTHHSHGITSMLLHCCSTECRGSPPAKQIVLPSHHLCKL